VSDRALNAAAARIVQETIGGAVSVTWSAWSEADGGPVWVVGSYAEQAAEFCVVISVFLEPEADDPTAVIVSRHATREAAIVEASRLLTDGATVRQEMGGY